MFDAMPCITCQNSLREYGKITPDWQWAYCSICGARYEVIPAFDENGQPQKAPDGHHLFYLNPVAHGDVSHYKDPDTMYEQEQVPTDFKNLKQAIDESNTVNDFFTALKKL